MTSHLVALQQRLSNENRYIAAATNKSEIDLRKVWITQIEKEIAGEIEFLAKKGVTIHIAEDEMSDEELLAALLT